jgi:hypothetical protein
MAEKINFLENSVCNGCIHLAIRSIRPIRLAQLLEELGIPTEELDIENLQEDIILKHYMCTKLGIELDHYVYECNLRQMGGGNNLLKGGLF